jgi:hypothetical protein
VEYPYLAAQGGAIDRCYDVYILLFLSHPFLIFMTYDDSSRTCWS